MAQDFAQEREKSLAVLTEARNVAAETHKPDLANQLDAQIKNFPTKEFKVDEGKLQAASLEGTTVGEIAEGGVDSQGLWQQMDDSFAERGEAPLPFDADDSDFATYFSEMVKTMGNANAMSAMAAAAASGDDTLAQVSAMKDQIEQEGEAGELDNIAQLIASDTDLDRRNFLQSAITDPNRTDQEIEDMLLGYMARREEGTSMQEEYMRRILTIDASVTEEEALVQDEKAPIADQIVEMQANKVRAENRLEVDRDVTIVNSIADMVMLMVPFTEQRMTAKITREAGLSNTWMEAFFMGMNKQKVQDALIRLDPEELAEMHSKLADSIIENSNIWGIDNDLVKKFNADQMIGGAGYGTTLKVIDNAITILDLLGVGWAFKGSKTMKGAAKGAAAGSPGGLAEVSNARTAAEMYARVLSDEGVEASKVIGVQRSEVITEVLPKPVGSDLKGAPPAVLETMERLDKEAAAVIESSGGQRLVYTEDELEATVKNGVEYLKTITGAKLHLGMSTLAEGVEKLSSAGEKALHIRAMFGANDLTGWKSLKSAKTAATKAFGKDQPVEFYVRDPVTNVAHSLSSQEGKKLNVVGNGDYFAELQYRQAYDKTTVGTFGSDSVSWLGGLPYVGKYVQDASSRFNQLIRGAPLTYIDQMSTLDRGLMKSTAKLFKGASEQSKARVMKALEEGYEQEQVWSYAELVSRYGMEPKEATAYLAFRRVADSHWELSNREMFKDLQSAGLESVHTGAAGDTGLFASRVSQGDIEKVVDTTTRLRKTDDYTMPVFNPKTNKVEDVTWDEITALYARDGSVAKLNQPQFVNNNKYSYILAENSPMKGGATTLKPLSRTPLSYRKGYFQRYYEQPYFIQKTYKNGTKDGLRPTKPITETLHVAGTRTDAEALVERLALDNADDGVEYGWKLARDLEDKARETADWDQIAKSGLTSARHRGERLTDAGLKMAEIADPLDSLVRSTRAIANKVSMGEWFATTRLRWANSYPDLTLNGTMPTTVEHIKQLGRKSKMPSKDINDAVAIFEYLKMMENAPTKLSKAWQGMAIQIAEALETKAPATSAGLRYISNSNVIRTIKTGAYATFIALNPLRQLPIQASQLIQMVAITPKYVLTGAMLRDIGAVSLGMMGQTRNGAKMMGLPHNEYMAVLDSFRKGGMPFSIDQHQFLESAVIRADNTLQPQSKLKRAATAPLKIAKGTYGAAKAVGFDAGEYTNILGHWLSARQLALKKNPKLDMKSQAAIDDIGQAGREMSYAMNRGGKIGHQGYPTSVFSELMSVPLQFFSIPHKAVMSMTSSRVYTASQKRRLAALNFALFGAAGIPLMSGILEEARGSFKIDVDDDTWVLIKGGMIDIALSRGLNAMFAEEGSNVDYLSVSKNIAPAGGSTVPLASLYQGITQGKYGKMFFGASWNVGSRIVTGAKEMALIMTAPGWDTPDRAIKGMRALLAITGGGSNYFKYMYAKKHHKIVSSKGGTTVDVGEVGALMKLYGIPTYAEEGYYNRVIDDSQRKKGIESTADWYYDSLMAIKSRDISVTDAAAEIEMLRGMWEIYDDPQDAEIAIDRINARMDMDASNNQANLAYKVAQKAGVGDTAERALNRLRTSLEIPEDMREPIEDMMEILLGQDKEDKE